MEASGSVERLLAAMESPVDGGLHTVGHQERVRIGARRELAGRTSRHVVRAHRDGVDRYLAVYRGDPGCDPSGIAVRALENCRTGRVRWDGDAGVLVAELLFDTRLRSGETYLFGYGFEDGTGGASGEYVRGFTFGGGQYVLQVGFDEAALRCGAAGSPRRRQRRARARGDLTLTGRHRTVHLVEEGVRPGLIGIDWDWE